ncbi:MAG TPA: acyl-CoA dehydrogenase [Kofleriaceae bacterium]|nr:acyl-CoA dehydrogenase [Kofleriaceae bacterium]
MSGDAPALTPRALERRLAELAAGDGAFSAAQLAELDRREAFPAAACAALDDAGLPGYYVPARHGGRLARYPDLIELWRAVARRDLTVAVAHGKTLLGTIGVWLAGSPEQAAWLGREVMAGAVVAWGLTERGHGSDLLAGELTATRTATGWRLDGEKWLINNATRGHVVAVLARTVPAGGPRGFSLILVDKRRLAPGSHRCLPRELTHGIRGADISGIALAGAEVPADALVGKVGEGIQTVLLGLQLTRTTCVGLSLGAAEHALRLAVDFAAEHRLYDRRLIELPRARRTLGEAAGALLVAEAVSAVAGRSVHALTGELSVISAITKALVPTLVDGLIAQLAELLGARAFLTEVHASGSFAKLERDHRIMAIFDGSTVVNRSALINQFPLLARAARAGRCDPAGLAAATTLTAALPALDPGRLALIASGCTVVQGVPAAVAAIRDRASSGRVSPAIAAMAGALGDAAAALQAELAATVPTPRDVPASAFTLAARYELCFAGAACLEIWLRNAELAAASDPGATGDAAAATAAALWRDALWLEAALRQVLERLGAAPGPEGARVHDRLADVVAAAPWPAAFSLLAAIPGEAP